MTKDDAQQCGMHHNEGKIVTTSYLSIFLWLWCIRKMCIAARKILLLYNNDGRRIEICSASIKIHLE